MWHGDPNAHWNSKGWLLELNNVLRDMNISLETKKATELLYQLFCISVNIGQFGGKGKT